jgi:hypothetical protein
MNDERDEVIERAARTLSALPPVRAGAVARVLMAVRASKTRPVPLWRRASWWFEDASVSARTAGLLVAASLAIGFVLRGTASRDEEFLPSPVASQVPAQPATNAGVQAMPVSMVLDLANAKSVSVVGDFNGWDPAATPMKRIGESGPWSATVLAKPGRHTYAFLVDGSTLVADPLAPKAGNSDFGGDASVMMVRTP